MDHDRKTVGAAVRKTVAAKQSNPLSAQTKKDMMNRFAIAAGVLEKLDVIGDPNTDRVDRLRLIIRYQMMVLIVLALVLVLVVFTKEKHVLYFAAREKTESVLLMPMMTPNHTDQAILSWVGSAASDILNFGFHNFAQRMQENRKYFTDDGWTSFKEAVERTGIPATIVQKQQVITAAPVGAAVIVDMKEDNLRGTEWTVQIPFTVTVLSGKESRAQRRILTVVIVRVPPEHNLTGLGIDNWVEIGG